jgi:hypothetical protein
VLAYRIHHSPPPWIRGFAIVALIGVVLVIGVVVAHAYVELQQPINSQAVEMNASVRAIPDLTALVRQSDLVAVGLVVGDGNTRLQVQPIVTPNANPPTPAPRGVSDPKAGSPNSVPPPAGPPGQLTLGRRPQTPVTSFGVEVERVAHGTAPAGQQITVVQPGGTISVATFPGGPVLTRTVQIEDDMLMRSGQRYVLFLKRGESGAFFVVGGAQGRLSVDTTLKVHPLNPGAPATQAHDGQPLDSFLAEVTATT